MTAFLERFTLSPDDVDAIVLRDIPVNKRFFAAMDKAERIRDDCQVLMAAEDGPTKAGYGPLPFYAYMRLKSAALG